MKLHIFTPFTRPQVIKIKDRTVIQRYLPKRIPTTLAMNRRAKKAYYA